MSHPDALPIHVNRNKQQADRTIHDLRAPLVTAIGFLNELRFSRQALLSQLSPVDDALKLDKGADKFVAEIDVEIGLCIEMIGDSLEELDGMMLGLRDLL